MAFKVGQRVVVLPSAEAGRPACLYPRHVGKKGEAVAVREEGGVTEYLVDDQYLDGKTDGRSCTLREWLRADELDHG